MKINENEKKERKKEREETMRIQGESDELSLDWCFGCRA